MELKGEKVELVPYGVEHVETYHNWMKSESLRELTATEDMDLEEHRKLQRDLTQATDRCTFIILDKSIPHDNFKYAMAGDINLFVSQEEDESNSSSSIKGELNIMIAEDKSRGKGLAKEAITLLMHYGIHHYKVQIYQAKIALSNTPSQKLFQSLGFSQDSIDHDFEEVTYSLSVESLSKNKDN
eukprot:TRINITY_DN2187_c0_g1_i3.p1 TRINITY_DN2187_c0_g1~~TRINITY_DN2187_c0_g1_i3.p1  ORF type:complete len:184 (-),score=50.37 TRINITY_DN2187_c0_g1_i3:8-559(-)